MNSNNVYLTPLRVAAEKIDQAANLSENLLTRVDEALILLSQMKPDDPAIIEAANTHDSEWRGGKRSPKEVIDEGVADLQSQANKLKKMLSKCGKKSRDSLQIT